MKNLLLFAMMGLLCNPLFSQKWAEMMQQPDANFYKIKKEFNRYMRHHEEEEKDKDKNVNGTEVEEDEAFLVYKRWESFVEPRVYPSGDLSLLSLTAKNYEKFLQENNAGNSSINGSNMTASTTWTAIGPFGPISGSAGGQLLKSGRLCFITIHPAGTNTLFVGAPYGGLWKSTNAGASWTTNTDNLTVPGCSDLAIDPTNASIMYLATGDGDAGDSPSVGVLKSTDGGATWAATGLTAPMSNNFLIRRLIINPSNTQILFAATNAGIYRTTNGGTNWSQVQNSSTYDIEFKPGTPNTIYAAGTSFRVSTDGGTTWTQISSGISTAAQRMAIAVTPANVNYVYVNASNSGGGTLGVYRSTNSGTSFTAMMTTPNIMGYNNPASGTTGQGWYDNAIAASPLNQDEVVVGGVNVWRSTNGGSTFACIGHWTGTGAPFIHADIHDLEYSTTGTLFATCDGTVYQYTGAAWNEICGLMNISQIYKIGCSATTANLWITGHQDNGTSTWNGATYTARIGGDGMDCFIDRTNNNNMFGSLYYADLRRSTNGGTSWSQIITGLTGTAPWVTAFKQDPVTAATLYCGLSNMFKSTNSGTSWTQLTALPGSGTVIEFAIAPSNNQIIYVLRPSGIYKTTDGGATWTTVTGTVPVGSASPTFLTIKPTDPNTVWVTLSGFIAGNKVFKTTNGGTAWTNISYNLPNLPANCSVFQNGTNDRIYAGMDAGVYWIDAGSTTWTLYNTGLPNVPVRDMEISAAASTKIRAATYGRGVWEVDVLPASVPPVCSFSVTSANKCVGQPIYLNDQSSNGPTSWSWTVTPSAGTTLNTPTSQNPTLTCTNPGTYTISLISTNGAGSGPVTNQTIIVSPNPTVGVSLASQTVCANSVVTLTASGATSYNWSAGGGSANTAVYTVVAFSTYTVTGTTAGCTGTAVASVSTKSLPVINATASNTNLCVGQTTTLNATGAASYTWSPGGSTGSTLVNSPTVTTTYTCSGTDINGCFGSNIITVFVSSCTGISQAMANVGMYSVYPNPTSGKLTVQIPTGKAITIVAEIVDLTGKVILKQNLNYTANDNTVNLNLSNVNSGMYFLKLNSGESSQQIIRIIKD